jgi:hypothetical protein
VTELERQIAADFERLYKRQEYFRLASAKYRRANRAKIYKYKRAWEARNPERVRAYIRKQHQKNAERDRERARDWHVKHRVANRARNKAWRKRVGFYKKWVAELATAYVKRLLAAQLGCSRVNVPDKLVELKREEIRLRRISRSMKQAVKQEKVK